MLATAPLSVMGRGCGRWNTRRSPNSRTPTRDPSRSLISAPNSMNSASISRHGMLPLVGCLNIEVSVRWWLRFKSPWYHETVPLGPGALHALQVVDQGVVGGVAARGPFQGAAADGKAASVCFLAGRKPAGLIAVDGGADLLAADEGQEVEQFRGERHGLSRPSAGGRPPRGRPNPVRRCSRSPGLPSACRRTRRRAVACPRSRSRRRRRPCSR